MALSGVRSSWLMLARNCDLCWLASASCRLLSWISSNSRTFSMAITAWSAKVVDSSICWPVNGRAVERVRIRTPIGVPSLSKWDPQHGAIARDLQDIRHIVFGIGEAIGDVNCPAFEQD